MYSYVTSDYSTGGTTETIHVYSNGHLDVQALQRYHFVRVGMHIEEPCDQTDAEPALASAPPMAKPELWIVPEASNTDPLLLAGMQIKAPLQGLQGPSPDIIPLGSLYFEFKQYKK